MTDRSKIAAKINVNDEVRLRLTKHGRSICGLKAPREDSEGWSIWPLWRVMKVFGPHLYVGCEMPFETSIEILEDGADG